MTLLEICNELIAIRKEEPGVDLSIVYAQLDGLIGRIEDAISEQDDKDNA